MNNLLFSLLFGSSLIANKLQCTLGSDAIISLSSDSDETTEEAANEGSYGAFGGFGVKVYDNDGSPQLLIYNEYDTSDKLYCISFDSTFEASSYNDTSCEYEEVDDSDNDVSFDNLDWQYSVCHNDSELESYDCDFAFYAENSDRFDLIRFIFYLEPSNTSESYYVKFSIEINGYNWTDSSSDDLLVLVLDMEDCSSEHSEANDSSEDDNDDDDDDDEDNSSGGDDGEDEEDDEEEDDETDASRRRRVLLGSGDDSDSREFDYETSWFYISDTANDGSVNVFMCADNNDGEIHIVYSHFDGDLFQDPEAGIQNDAMSFSSENGVSGTMTYVYQSMMVTAIVSIAMIGYLQ